MATTPITEAKGTDSRLDLVRKMLASADEKARYIANTDIEMSDSTREGFEREIEALTVRAAELIAKYGIDRAMLADSGTEADQVIDQVVWATRPYGQAMADLLRAIAQALGAQVRDVKEWDPTAPGGRTKGAWKYGLRLFVHSSDMLRIEMFYASLRNQAISGASRIKGTATFGQDQRAYRLQYLEGFRVAIYGRLDRAEKSARDAADAEQQEQADKALISGATVGRSVELVLTDRKSAVRNAMTLALYGKTAAEIDAGNAANRERWAEMDKRAQERYDAHRASHATCDKCKAAKSGYCNDHRDLKPTQGRAHIPRVGEEYWGVGHRDGTDADLGARAGSEVGGSRTAIR